jgi:hypothetical protein
MTGTPTGQLKLYTAAEVAVTLRCSEWWVKEHARRHRIPYCWIGGGYRFTDDHVAAIVRLCEVQPDSVPPSAPVRRPMTSDTPATPGRLRARPPRRRQGLSPVAPAA